MTLTPNVKMALRQFLSGEGESFVRTVFKALYVERITERELAKRLGHANALRVNTGRRAIEAIFGERELERLGYTACRDVHKAVRHWLKIHPLMSVETRTYLTTLEEKTNQQLKAYDIKRRKQKEAGSEPIVVSGVYVYTYPAYLNDREPLLKIGATNNLNSRIRDQQNTTAMPQPPIVVLRFQTDDPFYYERQIHAVLTEAGLHYRTGTGAKEWFKTTIEHVAVLAESLGLSRLY